MPHWVSTAPRAAAALCAALVLGVTARAGEPHLPLNATRVPLAETVDVGDRIERIRFLGMLLIPATTVNGLRFSQLSDLAWDDDAGLLYAISDKGALFHLRPLFDGNTLVDIRLVRALPLRELHSDQPLRGRRADTEGMDILHGRNRRPQDTELIISFERLPRIWRYRPDGRALAELPLPAPLDDVRAYDNGNRMLEAMCIDDSFGPLTMPEAPLRKEQRGHNRIFSLGGKSWLYPVENSNRVVGMACLGDGDVIVLERDYGRLLWRASTALKRVRLSAANAGAVVTPERLVTLDTTQGFQIDNFEGITPHHGNRFFLISDNNDLFVQRTLLLYIELLRDPVP
ncbi:MAG: esterase-like activity of phytase family protein [Gammaproteobacteria bacterium]